MRKTLDFTVSVEGGRFLQADGSVGPEDTAATFSLHAGPTMRQKTAADEAVFAEAGGLETWLEWTDVKGRLRSVIEEDIQAELWPEGRPAVDGPADKEAQDERLAKAWMADDSPAMRHLNVIYDRMRRVEAIAMWKFLAVDVPDAFADIGDLDDEATFFAIWATWKLSQAPGALGKPQPTPSSEEAGS